MSRGQQLQRASSGSASPPFTCAAPSEKCEVSDVITERGRKAPALNLGTCIRPPPRPWRQHLGRHDDVPHPPPLITGPCPLLPDVHSRARKSPSPTFLSPTRRNATQARVKNAASRTSWGNFGTKKCSARVANKNGKIRLRPQLIIFFYWCLIHQFFQLIIKPVKFPQRSDKPSQRKKEQILASERAEPLNVWTF